jgi:hypothetical protein
MKALRSNILLLTALLAILSLPKIAFANDLDCLALTKGHVVEWDKDWQADLSDNGVRYKITEIKTVTRPQNPKAIELSLVAQGSANKPVRTARIVKELAAHLFCERIVGGLRNPSVGVLTALGGRDAARAHAAEIDSFFPAYEVDPASLSFRRWHDGRWVAARPQPGEQEFVCQTEVLAFACGEQDYRWLQGQKLTVSKPWVELRLPGPFLRYTNQGWVRELPIGALAEVPISECPVLNRKFFCVTSEKEKFGAQLKAAEEELALQLKLHPPVAEAKKPVPTKKHRE